MEYNIHKAEIIKKHKIFFFIGTTFLIISSNVILGHILPLETFKFLFLINLVLIFGYYFTLFGKVWHPIFMFLSTLTLFQGGLIITSIFDPNIDLSYITLMGANINLEENNVRLTILLILLSYWFVLIGALLGNNIKSFSSYAIKNKDEKLVKNFFLFVFCLTIPFYIYKNLIYFKYFLQHTYLGFYRSTEYLERAGFVTRFLGYFTFISFLGYFLLEQNKNKILMITLLWFILTLPIFFCGFRGSFFSFWCTTFIFYKHKFGNRLSLKEILFIPIIISVLGLIVSSIRENLNFDLNLLKLIINSNPLLEFLKQQGVSFYVTAMAIQFYDEFAGNILKYLMYELPSALFSYITSNPGRAFATDLMIKINYEVFLLGYGTGSSYLAESYLLGGPVGVCLISFLIGYILSKLYIHFDFVNIWFKILIFVSLQYVFLLPRDLLLMPISQDIKAGFYLLLMFLFIKFRKLNIKNEL